MGLIALEGFTNARARLRWFGTFLAFYVGITPVWSQIENIPVSDDMTVDKAYVGVLAQTFIEQHTLQQSGALTFQGGGRVKLSLIPKVLYLRSFGVFRVLNSGTSQAFTNFESIITPMAKLEIHLGVMATPTTLLRPNPSTWESQVETHAERTILGGRPGGRMEYQFNDAWHVAYGFHWQTSEPSHHVKITFNDFSFATYIQINRVFGAIRWDADQFQLVSTYDERRYALSAFFDVFPNYKVFTDLAYDEQAKKLTFGEWGIRRHFSGNHLIRGFFNMSYNQVTDRFQGGFFIHI